MLQPLGFTPPPNYPAVCSLQRPSAFTDAELVKQIDSVTSILNRTDRLSNRAQNAASRLRQALVELEVRQLKEKAISQGVWDFYPTPAPVVETMISLAQLQPHHLVLEPSAGAGDLASAIANHGVQRVDCFEIHPLLRQALQLQQFNLIGSDFLIAAPNSIYDRILINPPFGSNGVANHVLHAYQFLKPGGKLISLAHHYQLQPSQSDRYFFDWLKSKKARFLNLGKAFQKGDCEASRRHRKTSVPIQLIAIDKS